MTRYVISPERSRMWIDARSNVHPIHSSTDGVEGYVELELASDGGLNVSVSPAGELSLSVDRLSSGNRLEDRELHKRIDSRRYPNILGVLKKMEPSGVEGTYRVSGDITFRGVSRQHEDLMNVSSVDGQTIQLEGKSRFDIREFGMEPPRLLMARVEPEVEVRIQIVAVKQS
jgi:polyisoprenoid-binding protein YceI